MSRDAGAYRVRVDWTRCDGHGLCAALLPEVIGRDEWGFPVVTGDVVNGQHRHARRAVAACPALALRLERLPDAQRSRPLTGNTHR